MTNHRSYVRRIHFVVLFVAIALLAGGCERGRGSDGDTATKVSVRFPIPIVEAGQSPYYLALDRGYYAEEGLEVSFEMGSKELNPVKTVANGQDTFGILGGPDTLIVARSRDVMIKAIAVIHRNSNFPCLLTLKSSGLNTAEELAGKKVGFFYGHISTDVLRSLFEKVGAEVTEVDVGFDYSQLISKQIAAEWAFTVTAGLDLPAKGVEVNVISPADYGIVTHGYTLFATDRTVAERPELVERFLRASLKGVRDAVQEPKAAVKALLKRDSTLDYELNLRRQELYNTVTSTTGQDGYGHVDLEMLQPTYQRLEELGVLKNPFDLQAAFTTEFLKDAQPIEKHGQ